MAQNKWTETSLSPLAIQLDSQNPRIEVAGNASQEEIRLKLLAHESVMKLANQIVKFGGLMPGERIIVCKENRKYVVVEGNRRVCATQILLKPDLLPEKLRKQIPIVSQELKESLKKIKADVAPNRDAAEPTITKRHTEPGIEKWRTTAKMRRASKLLEAGYDLAQIAEKLGAKQSALRIAIREYRLLRYVLDLEGVWSSGELLRLTDQTLQTNPYTRFFSLAGVKDKLELSFDENDHIVSSLPKNIFNQYMSHIARCFFIPVAPHKKPWANTRTASDDIFNNFTPTNDDPVVGASNMHDVTRHTSTSTGSGSTAISFTSAPTGKKNPKQSAAQSAQASVFFEKLICAVEDDRLIALTGEIKKIDHFNFPIAASMLLRALFESSLVYQVKKAEKLKELNKKQNGKDIGLQALISFCANAQNQIFTHKRAGDALANFEKAGLKDHLDFVVHGRWAEAKAPLLESAAGLLRPLIRHIVEGNDHDMESTNA